VRTEHGVEDLQAALDAAHEAGFSSGVTTRGGLAGAMPRAPSKRSKRIWMGVGTAMEFLR